jgi:hypothetical protein
MLEVAQTLGRSALACRHSLGAKVGYADIPRMNGPRPSEGRPNRRFGRLATMEGGRWSDLQFRSGRHPKAR